MTLVDSVTLVDSDKFTKCTLHYWMYIPNLLDGAPCVHRQNVVVVTNICYQIVEGGCKVGRNTHVKWVVNLIVYLIYTNKRIVTTLL